MSQRNPQLAQIHIGKKDLGLDDDTYRTMLWTVARVKSASDLDLHGRNAVIAHMKSLGWQPMSKHRKLTGSPAVVMAIWLDLHRLGGTKSKSDKALRSFMRRTLGDDEELPADIQWLDAKQCNRLIETLKQWRDRIQKQGEKPQGAA